MRSGYVLQIARLTLQEAVSRRLILAGVLISLGYLALFAVGFRLAYGLALNNPANAQTRLAVGLAFATLTLFGVYVVNYLASFLALFLSVGAISGEIDAGTLHAVLARPLRRSEFLLGRWIGYASMLVAYIVAMTGLVLLTARAISGYEVPDPVPAVALMLLEGLLLLTLSLFGSTLMSTLANGVVVFTLLGLAWLAGIIEFVGRLLDNPTMLNLGTAVSLLLPSDALWRGASYYLQSPAVLTVTGAARGGIPFFSSVPVAPALVGWAVGYVVVVLVGAMLCFSRRDL
jgi:ABC-2 type transport system permease protein